MKLKRFNDYYFEQMAEEMFQSLDGVINESDDSSWKKVSEKIISDLKLNLKFVGTFGTGINAFFPIVDSIMRNTKLSIEKTPEVIVMMTITAFAILYIEGGKCKNEKEKASLEKDSKSLLEELKLRGVGNGIVKKLIKSFKSIKNIFFTIAKKTGIVIGEFIDMFAYTSILIPIMNGILFLINKYQFNLDTIIDNFIGLAVGVGTISTKHAIVDLIKKLKNKVVITKKDEDEILGSIDSPKIKKVNQLIDPSIEDIKPDEMINEQ
jgi:hypothetical protein